MTDTEQPGRQKGMWARARAIAEATPAERNRSVDFLRALSILAVVVGHWLVAAPSMQDGAVVGGHLLGILPWTQWLTWGFQVMPIFFLVGGFSNGVSWAATQRSGGSFAAWYSGRLQRLINPVLPLFLLWTLFALFGTAAGVDRDIVALAAQLALIPIWFLSVYLMVTAAVPWTYAAWRRWGWLSVALLVAAAVIIDVAAIGYAVPYVNFANFGFVWLAVHQLGFAWRDGRFAQPGMAATTAVLGLTALGLLVGFGPYPVAMIGVPGSDLSNSMPPTLALLALGVAQTGLALSAELMLRRMLDNVRLWTAVVLINGMIMTIYLWHLTAFVLVMVGAWLLGGVGLEVAPGSAAWWAARPLWFALYSMVTFALISPFVRFENLRTEPRVRDVPHGRLFAGLLLICIGLGATAAISIASPAGVTGVRLWLVALPFVGAALAGFGPVAHGVRRIR